MMRALACLVALAAGCIVASVLGCDFTVFHHGWPDGLHCSDAGTCPSNGQVCTAELICRHPCTTSADCPGNGNADHCDVDGYCRKSCSNGGSMCAPGSATTTAITATATASAISRATPARARRDSNATAHATCAVRCRASDGRSSFPKLAQRGHRHPPIGLIEIDRRPALGLLAPPAQQLPHGAGEVADRGAPQGTWGDELRHVLVEKLGDDVDPRSIDDLPILWSAGTGADLMKRIAAPMVGGLITSFALELLVYPAIYKLWKRRRLPRTEGTVCQS
jgi:hypothetical protein